MDGGSESQANPLADRRPLVFGEVKKTLPLPAEFPCTTSCPREAELQRLREITDRINGALTLAEVLEYAYLETGRIIPSNRMSFSLVDDDKKRVTAIWTKSDRSMTLKDGYSADLSGSTLEQIVKTARPRIINDLEEYLRQHPNSHSTSLIVGEGMRSSLTCPLIVRGRPIGFLFFSSDQVGAYSEGHVDFFMQIASSFSTIVEKGRLYSQLAQQKAVVQRQNDLMEADLRLARRVQQASIPLNPPSVDGLDIAVEYCPAGHVGGDLICLIPMGDGRMLMFLGDAMGHGVQAALVMSAANAAVRSAAGTSCDPAEILNSVNKLVCGIVANHFVTAVCAMLDIKAGKVILAVAGHPNPIVLRAATGVLESPSAKGLPLGVHDDTLYTTTQIAISPGDLILFYSDGIVEATDVDMIQFGEDRLEAAVRGGRELNAEKLVRKIVLDLQNFRGDKSAEDDISLLAVKLK